MKNYLKRFPHALRGLWFATKTDVSFRTHIYLGLLILILLASFYKSVSQTELLFICAAYALILITELQNSALESALDKLHPEIHKDIKNSKDMAAAAVLISGGFLFIVLLVICWGKF